MNREALLITGVSSGVGLSLARYLAGSYRVIGIARRLEPARAALAGVATLDLLAADLAHPDEVEACLDLVVERHGVPAHLVNNAGVNLPGRIDALDPGAFATSLQVNCLAPIAFMRRLLPAMAAAGYGRIVNVTSGAPLNCFPGYAAYSASKAALNAATVTAAREHADANVRVNLMSPGPVRSNMAPNAPMDPSVCHPTIDVLLDPDPATPSGRFFWLGYEIPLFPDLDGVRWLEGEASGRFRRVL
jgi:NAD(P)-dependent dehydrogenase (short-subunit alcohol dehydrogenase family)